MSPAGGWAGNSISEDPRMQIRPDTSAHLRDLPLVPEQGRTPGSQGIPLEGPPVEPSSSSADGLGLPSPAQDGLRLATPDAIRAGRGDQVASLGNRLLGTLAAALPLPGPQLVAMQVPVTLLGFQKPPAEIPEALWKACGKRHDVASPLAARVRSMQCTEDERAALVPVMATLLKSCEGKIDLKAALDAVDGKPDVTWRFEAYAELVSASRNPKQALVDLKMVEDCGAATQVPLPEVGTTVTALRRHDHQVGEYYPRYTNLTPSVDFVLGSPDAAVRAARLHDITSISSEAKRELPAALAQATVLASLPCPPDQRGAIRESWIGLIKPWRASADEALLEGLEKAAAVPDAQAALADLTTLVAATKRPTEGAADFGLAITSATAKGIDRTEVVTLLKALREHDPNREDGYENLADVTGALAHALKGDSRVARHERTQALLAMQGQGRNVAQVTPLAERVEALNCSPAGKAAIAQDLTKALSEYNSRADEHFMAALNTVDSPEAQRKWEGFRTLVTASKRTGTAASDVALASTLAPSRGIGFGEIVSQLEVLRRADPNMAEGYYALIDPRPVLEVTLAPADAASRTRVLETLISLQKKGRNGSQALPFLKEILALQKGPQAATAGAVLLGTQQILEAYRERADETLLGALKEATASPCPDHRLEQFATHAKATGRVDLALDDLQMTREVSASSQVPFDEVLSHLARLREIDPAKGDAYEAYAPARPALDVITAAPDAGARQKELESLLALQVNGRTLNQTVPLLQGLHRMRGGPSASHEGSVQASLSSHLKAWNSRSDEVFVALLGDLVASGNATLEMKRFDSLLAVLKRPQQALDDLRLTRDLATRYPCDQGSIVDTVLNLRKADPNLGDGYYRVADIRKTLENLVSRTAGTGQAADLSDAATHFMSFQRKGRNAESAQHHANALEAVKVSPADRPALEKAYIGLLDAYSARSDDFLMDVLAIAGTTPNPTTTLGHFCKLTEICKRSEPARDDLRLTVEKAARLQVPLAEAVELVGTLRKGDPAVGDSYDGFQALDGALEWVLQGKDSTTRSDRTQRLVAMQGLGRVLDDGLKHEVRLDALHVSDAERTSVREAYHEFLKQYNYRNDEIMVQALDWVDNQADASALMRACTQLAKASSSPATALVDLKALQEAVQQTGLPIDEVTSLLHQVRLGDPERGDSYKKAASLSEPAVPVLAGGDAATRAARAESLATLWTWSGHAGRATQGLEWIVATPLPKDGMKDAAVTMGALLRRLDKSTREDDVRTIYQRTVEVTATEKVSLWRRLTRQGSLYKATLWQAVSYSRDASDVLALMQSLERSRFEGEDVGDTMKRVKKILATAGYDDRPSTDIDAARNALEHARVKVAWGGEEHTPRTNWKTIHKMAGALGSVRAADVVWQCMAAATTEAEANQRRDAFDRLLKMTRDTDGAVRAYQALSRVLAPAEAVAGPLAEMESLLKNQGSELAAETWAVAHESRGLTDGERKAAQAVLTRARDAETLRGLWQRLQTPVQGESFSARTEILRQAIEAGRSTEAGLEVYSSIQKEFAGPGEFEQGGTSFVSLVGMLAQRSRAPLAEALSALAWLRSLRTVTGDAGASDPTRGAGATQGTSEGTPTSNAGTAALDPHATPIAELLMAFTSHLMMGADFEKAKALVRGEEQRKKREREGTVVAGVHVGEHEVTVGGVRIKVRKNSGDTQMG